MRLLNGARARQRRLLSKLVRRPAVVERVLGPGPDDDLDLLGEQPKSLPRIEERKPVLDVLTLVPAGAHAHVDASSGDVVDGDRHPGEHARMPERRRRDERAESNPLRDRSQPGERRPRVERACLRANDRRVVIGAKESLETVVFDEPSETHPVLPGDALLPLDHQACDRTDRRAVQARSQPRVHAPRSPGAPGNQLEPRQRRAQWAWRAGQAPV